MPLAEVDLFYPPVTSPPWPSFARPPPYENGQHFRLGTLLRAEIQSTDDQHMKVHWHMVLPRIRFHENDLELAIHFRDASLRHPERRKLLTDLFRGPHITMRMELMGRLQALWAASITERFELSNVRMMNSNELAHYSESKKPVQIDKDRFRVGRYLNNPTQKGFRDIDNLYYDRKTREVTIYYRRDIIKKMSMLFNHTDTEPNVRFTEPLKDVYWSPTRDQQG